MMDIALRSDNTSKCEDMKSIPHSSSRNERASCGYKSSFWGFIPLPRLLTCSYRVLLNMLRMRADKSMKR